MLSLQVTILASWWPEIPPSPTWRSERSPSVQAAGALQSLLLKAPKPRVQEVEPILTAGIRAYYSEQSFRCVWGSSRCSKTLMFLGLDVTINRSGTVAWIAHLPRKMLGWIGNPTMPGISRNARRRHSGPTAASRGSRALTMPPNTGNGVV